jgi:hypothetical protein
LNHSPEPYSTTIGLLQHRRCHRAFFPFIWPPFVLGIRHEGCIEHVELPRDSKKYDYYPSTWRLFMNKCQTVVAFTHSYLLSLPRFPSARQSRTRDAEVILDVACAATIALVPEPFVAALALLHYRRFH